MRAFIRHPAEFPIEVIDEGGRGHTEPMNNVSLGGLACSWSSMLPRGAQVQIRITGIRPQFRARGEVAWSRPEGDAYALGIRFMSKNDAFRARMVEQICHILRYREDALKEGRKLSVDEAAHEWIERHAGDFPA